MNLARRVISEVKPSIPLISDEKLLSVIPKENLPKLKSTVSKLLQVYGKLDSILAEIEELDPHGSLSDNKKFYAAIKPVSDFEDDLRRLYHQEFLKLTGRGFHDVQIDEDPRVSPDIRKFFEKVSTLSNHPIHHVMRSKQFSFSTTRAASSKKMSTPAAPRVEKPKHVPSAPSGVDSRFKRLKPLIPKILRYVKKAGFTPKEITEHPEGATWPKVLIPYDMKSEFALLSFKIPNISLEGETSLETNMARDLYDDLDPTYFPRSHNRKSLAYAARNSHHSLGKFYSLGSNEVFFAIVVKTQRRKKR